MAMLVRISGAAAPRSMPHGPPAVGTLDLTTLAPQPGVNAVATATEQAGFNADDVVTLSVHFNGSSALDNLSFCP